MALGTNLTLAQFFDGIDFEDLAFNLDFHQETSRAGGELLVADLAAASWRLEGTSIPYLHATAQKHIALINSRRGGLQTFLGANRSAQYPALDPDGSIFGSSTPVVGTITDRNTLAFTGFPSTYGISVGDLFQIIYDTSRYYLGMFCEAKTASGGAISAVSVTPPLPDLITGGEAVTVKKPAAKFRVTPGSAHIQTINGLYSTVAFTAEQTSAK